MTIAQARVGDVVILDPGERIDVESAPKFREVVEEVFAGADRKLVIDLAGVHYISSVGLAACLKAAQLAQTNGGRVVFCEPNDSVREVFELTGLDSVVEIFTTCAAAVASFHGLVPRPPGASGATAGERATTLTVPEEILLLTLDDEGGRFLQLPEHALEFALAGAVLMDLAMRNRIDLQEQLVAVDGSPIGDDVLDPVLKAIASQPQRGVEPWLHGLAREAGEIKRRVIDRLVHRGILERKDNVLHWMLGGRRYPMIDNRDWREVKSRVLGVLRSNDVPSPQDVVIIALADTCAVFDSLFGLDEMLDVRPRIAEVARMDLMAQAMARALDQARTSENWKHDTETIYGSTADLSR